MVPATTQAWAVGPAAAAMKLRGGGRKLMKVTADKLKNVHSNKKEEAKRPRGGVSENCYYFLETKI